MRGTGLGLVTLCVGVACIATGCSLALDTGPFRGPLPSQPGLTLSTSEPTTLDDLVVTATSTDPLGESVGFVYEWWRTPAAGAEEKQDNLDSNVVISRLTKRGEVWRVRVTPVTGVSGRQGEPTEAEVTILNTPPVVQSIGFSTYEPHVNARVEAFPAVVDADRDPASLQYQWLLNDIEIEGAHAPTLKLSDLDNLEAGDERKVTCVASDPELGPSSTSSAILLQDDVDRWQPVLPNRSTDGWWSFWDPLHRRFLLLSDTPSGEGAYWEMAVDSSTGEARFVALPEPATPVAAEQLKAFRMVYDPVAKRGLVFGANSLEEGETVVLYLDLQDRARLVGGMLPTEGTPPPARFWYASIYDEVRHRVWLIGGVSLTQQTLSDAWVLELAEDPPRWRQSTASLSRPIGGATVVDVPGESRAFLFGGIDVEEEITTPDDYIPLNVVFEADFSDDELVLLPRTPLPRAAFRAFGAFVPDATDPLEDRIIVGTGIKEPFGLSPVEHVWSYHPRIDTAPVEIAGLTEYPEYVDLQGPRNAVYDEQLDRILIETAGGTGSSSSLTRGYWAVDPETLSSTPLTRYGVDLPPALAYAVTTGFTIWGGAQMPQSPVEESIWLWDQVFERFGLTEASLNMPAPRAAARAPNGGLLFGGVLGWPEGLVPHVEPDLSRLESSESWTPLTISTGPDLVPRFGHASFRCGADNDYYYFGGTLEGVGDVNDVGRLTCDTLACTHDPDLTPGEGPSPRSFATSFRELAESTLLLGGSGGGDELWRFNCPSGSAPSWEPVTIIGAEAPSARAGHTFSQLAFIGQPTRHLLVGGTLATDHTDIWELELVGAGEYSWEKLSPLGPLPRPRAHHVVLWDPLRRQLLLYGGDSAEASALSDFWSLRFAPAAE